MRISLKTKNFAYYKGKRIAKFSDSLAYYDGSELFIVTKNFGREGPLGLNVDLFPLLSFGDELEITNNSIISGRSFIGFTDCEVWNQNVSDLRFDLNKVLAVEVDLIKELSKRVDEALMDKIFNLLDKKDYNNLSGLGPGLTPLGDDILSGMVLIDKTLSNLDIESVFSRHLFENAITNDVPYPIMKFLETTNLNFLKKMGSSSGLGYGLGIIKSIKSGGRNVKSFN
jgi:hypothetical protein